MTEEQIRLETLKQHWFTVMRQHEEEAKRAKAYYDYWCSELAKCLNKDESDERNI